MREKAAAFNEYQEAAKLSMLLEKLPLVRLPFSSLLFFNQSIRFGSVRFRKCAVSVYE